MLSTVDKPSSHSNRRKAFAGELTKDWREKHPELITGENSAEKLLEKIKAEKALTVVERKKPRSKKTKEK